MKLRTRRNSRTNALALRPFFMVFPNITTLVDAFHRIGSKLRRPDIDLFLQNQCEPDILLENDLYNASNFCKLNNREFVSVTRDINILFGSDNIHSKRAYHLYWLCEELSEYIAASYKWSVHINDQTKDLLIVDALMELFDVFGLMYKLSHEFQFDKRDMQVFLGFYVKILDSTAAVKGVPFASTVDKELPLPTYGKFTLRLGLNSIRQLLDSVTIHDLSLAINHWEQKQVSRGRGVSQAFLESIIVLFSKSHRIFKSVDSIESSDFVVHLLGGQSGEMLLLHFLSSFIEGAGLAEFGSQSK